MRTTLKYLSSYAELESSLTHQITDVFEQAVVVPLHDEMELIHGLLDSLARAATKRTLIILVVNGRTANDSGHAVLKQLRQHPHTAVTSNTFLIRHSADLHLLVIDRLSPPHTFNVKQGVGLARKIGCDIALALYSQNKLRSPWVSTTDADARVTTDFFNVPDPVHKACTVIHRPYFHLVDPEKDLEHILYEISLHYYLLGLKFAQSLYAHPALGSSLIVHLPTYAQLRGFPNLLAGEDFYFLDKACKLGPIEVNGSPVFLIPRPSGRVPFGTGQGTSRIAQQLKLGLDFPLIPPACFLVLRDWIQTLPTLLTATSQDKDPIGSFVSRLDPCFRTLTVGYFKQIGLDERIKYLRQLRATQPHKDRQLSVWFDGLKTLRFLHTLRDCSAEMDWRTCLKVSPFVAVGRCQSPMEFLAALREQVWGYSRPEVQAQIQTEFNADLVYAEA